MRFAKLRAGQYGHGLEPFQCCPRSTLTVACAVLSGLKTLNQRQAPSFLTSVKRANEEQRTNQASLAEFLIEHKLSTVGKLHD